MHPIIFRFKTTYSRDLNLGDGEGSCGGNKGGDDSVLHFDRVVSWNRIVVSVLAGDGNWQASAVADTQCSSRS
jgi:hypothetical protein